MRKLTIWTLAALGIALAACAPPSAEPPPTPAVADQEQEHDHDGRYAPADHDHDHQHQAATPPKHDHEHDHPELVATPERPSIFETAEVVGAALDRASRELAIPLPPAIRAELICIAHAESGGYLDAVGDLQLQRSVQGSFGLWQINIQHFAGRTIEQVEASGFLTDIDWQARKALEVWSAQGLAAWSTYNAGLCPISG